VVGEGEIEIDLPNGDIKVVEIERLHLEQDAGKSMHDQHPTKTHIDLNRSGVTLMEIVSKPDMRSAEEAVVYVTKVRSILRYIESCDGNMQEGSLRCDANVSVRRPGDELGTRCEIKNLNSLRFLRQAIDHEAVRQIEVIEDGGVITQETRLYDPDKGETRSMRSKEEAHDYRYFPDPDLLPLDLSEDFVAAMKASLPELPDVRKSRLVSEFGLSAYDASVLVAERETVDYFETVANGRDAKLAANWVISDLFGRLNKTGTPVSQSPVKAEALGELIDLISDQTISGRIAKDVFADMFENGKGAAAIVEDKGLRQVTDAGAIRAQVQAVIDANPDKVADYRGGNQKLVGWFMGQVMQASQGKANPAMVNQLLKEIILG
jgi:aspartyl-tRNA(Asn)/glutamyl-tRNA(Gln) amidotransferase subunit B